MLFMLCTFGYMIFLIIYKFCVDNPNPPNLIQVCELFKFHYCFALSEETCALFGSIERVTYCCVFWCVFLVSQQPDDDQHVFVARISRERQAAVSFAGQSSGCSGADCSAQCSMDAHV